MYNLILKYYYKHDGQIHTVVLFCSHIELRKKDIVFTYYVRSGKKFKTSLKLDRIVSVDIGLVNKEYSMAEGVRG